MFLITFDIIDSRKQKIKLIQVPFIDSYLKDLAMKYNINNINIQIHDGDQIRILVKDTKYIFNIIVETFSALEINGLKARVFLTAGSIDTLEYNNLLEADGSVFHRNKKLEQQVKSDKNYYSKKENSIRYLGEDNTDLIDLLCLSLSRLCLKSQNSSTILNLIFYEEYNQTDVGQQLEMTQVNVSKKLKRINSEMFLKFTKQIDLLLKQEVNCNE